MRICFWKDGGSENESNQVVILAINLRLRNRCVIRLAFIQQVVDYVRLTESVLPATTSARSQLSRSHPAEGKSSRRNDGAPLRSGPSSRPPPAQRCSHDHRRCAPSTPHLRSWQRPSRKPE